MSLQETRKGKTPFPKEYPPVIDYLKQEEIMRIIEVRLATSGKQLVLSEKGKLQQTEGLVENEWLLETAGIHSNIWFGDFPNPIWDHYKPTQEQPYNERTRAACLYEVLETLKEKGWIGDFDFGPVLEERDGSLRPIRGPFTSPFMSEEIAIFVQSREKNHEHIRQRVNRELNRRLKHPPKTK